MICCGDLNVAHQEIDLKNPKTNRKNAGFTDEERACFGRGAGEWIYRYIPLFLSGCRRAAIPGGLTDLKQERRMQGGELTILSRLHS